jgi:hypothetical protein
MVAFIVTVNKCAQITRERISSENGVTAAVRHAITFSNDPFFSGRCAWAKTLLTSARVPQPNKKVLRPVGAQQAQQLRQLKRHRQ